MNWVTAACRRAVLKKVELDVLQHQQTNYASRRLQVLSVEGKLLVLSVEGKHPSRGSTLKNQKANQKQHAKYAESGT